MRKFQCIASFLLASALAACGDGGSSSGKSANPPPASHPLPQAPQANEPLCALADAHQPPTYRFIEGSCDTGVHRFATREEFCTALRRQDLNRHCAIASRYYCFVESCPDQTWQIVTGDASGLRQPLSP